ncbi:MAG: hypothetical protein CML17_12595 [Pusillimonas sp.]|jgi:enoyl-CoA hydratase/carnithine racemase|nr:hypothetical protein [Pusillimonas sp.]
MVEIPVGVSANNNVSAQHIQELLDQFRLAEQHCQPICFVAKNPGRFFCSGFDLAELIDLPEKQVAATFETFLMLARAIFHSPCRVGVLANGHAVGVGAMLALAADRCVMQQQAKLRFPEVQLGLGLFSDIVDLIRYRVAPAKAEIMLCDAVGLEAERAVQLGLISGYYNQPGELGNKGLLLNTVGPFNAAANMKQLCRNGFLQSPVATQVDDFMRLWLSAETQQSLHKFIESTSSRTG